MQCVCHFRSLRVRRLVFGGNLVVLHSCSAHCAPRTLSAQASPTSLAFCCPWRHWQNALHERQQIKSGAAVSIRLSRRVRLICRWCKVDIETSRQREGRSECKRQLDDDQWRRVVCRHGPPTAHPRRVGRDGQSRRPILFRRFRRRRRRSDNGVVNNDCCPRASQSRTDLCDCGFWLRRTLTHSDGQLCDDYRH